MKFTVILKYPNHDTGYSVQQVDVPCVKPLPSKKLQERIRTAAIGAFARVRCIDFEEASDDMEMILVFEGHIQPFWQVLA